MYRVIHIVQATGRLLLQSVRVELGCVQHTCGVDEPIDTDFSKYGNQDDGVRPGKFYSRSQTYYGY